MNRFRLRIFGLMVLILAVVIGVYFFRPGRPSNSQDGGRIALQPQPRTGEPTADADLTATRPISLQTSRSEDPRATDLQQTASSLVALYRNPGSPEAVKARQTLLNLPQGPQRPAIFAGKDVRQQLLKRTAASTADTSGPHSQQPHASTIMRSIEASAGTGAENLQQASQKVLEEHLKQYKAARNELFPMYQSNLPVGLINRLPTQYRQQTMTGMAQRSFTYPGSPGAEGASGLSAGALRANFGRSSPAGTTMPAESFKNFSTASARRPAASKSPAPPEQGNTADGKSH